MGLRKRGHHPFLRAPFAQAAEHARPVPSEEPATQAGGKKKHHLLRHELTAEAQAAAVAHFGAESVDEAAHNVWGLKCVLLQGVSSVGISVAFKEPTWGLRVLWWLCMSSQGIVFCLSVELQHLPPRCLPVCCSHSSAGSANCRKHSPRFTARKLAHATMVRGTAWMPSTLPAASEP